MSKAAQKPRRSSDPVQEDLLSSMTSAVGNIQALELLRPGSKRIHSTLVSTSSNPEEYGTTVTVDVLDAYTTIKKHLEELGIKA